MGKPRGNSLGPGSPGSPGLKNLSHTLRDHLCHILTLLRSHKHTQQLILKSHNWRHFALQGCQSNCLLTRFKMRVKCTGNQLSIFKLPLILNTSKSPHCCLSEEYDPLEAILFGNLKTLANFYDWNISPWHHQYDTVSLLSNLNYKYLS